MWRVAAFVCVAIGEGTDSGTDSDTDFCSVLVYRRLRGECALVTDLFIFVFFNDFAVSAPERSMFWRYKSSG